MRDSSPEQAILTITPQSLTVTLHFDFKSFVGERVLSITCTQQQTLPWVCLYSYNLRIILEVVCGIFLGALVLGQPKYFLYFNSHAESMPVFLTVSLHSFFSEEIILTGNNFKPGRVSVGGEGTRGRGQRIGRVSKMFKKLFGNLPISKVTKTPVKLRKVVYLMKCFMWKNFCGNQWRAQPSYQVIIGGNRQQERMKEHGGRSPWGRWGTQQKS